jgi:LAS superfamily LD-carboxypeptidase LdcB
MDSSLSGAAMYNQGRYAIDVLAAGGAVASVAQAVGLSGPNTTGINPDDVFQFTNSGSSTRSAFDQLTGPFKDAILKMAKDYDAIKGGKITITSCYRSSDYQQKIYNEWVAAGGSATNPTATTPDFGPVTTPAQPGGKPESHGSGVAIDSGLASLIAKTVNLPSYGLRWGGTFSKPDLVHIQLANWSPSN